MAKDCSESAPNLTGSVDVDKVRQAVRQWRQAYKDLGFEHQRQRDELVHLGMQEKLSEDNEKLLRQENAALKATLAGCAEAPGALKRLRAENEALREDLDDARASLCAGALEHQAKQAELRTRLDAERREREAAQRALAAEAEARASLHAQLEKRAEEGERLAAQLSASREQLKAKEQEYRCQLIAGKLERDEQVMRLEGRLQRLQTSGHDLCRQQYAALQQELAQARSELARRQPSRASASRPPSPKKASQQSPAGLADAAQGKIVRCGAAPSVDVGDTFGSPAAGEETGALAPAFDTGKTPTRRSVQEAPKPVSDETVDSTHSSNFHGTPPQRLASKSPSADLTPAGRPLRVFELLAKSRRPKTATPREKFGTDDDGDVVDESDPGEEDVADGDLSAPDTPPLASSKSKKKRKLLLEVDDMLFVEND